MEIERTQCKDICDGQVETPAIFIVDSHIMADEYRGSRAYTMPEMLKSRPQQADLNVHANLSASRHTQYSFTVCGLN